MELLHLEDFFCDDGAGDYPEGAAFSRVENNGKRYKAIFN